MTDERQQTQRLVVTDSGSLGLGPAASIEAVVRAYADAAVRQDFGALCSYLSDAGRAMALLEARDRRLRTDSCEAALAHIATSSTADYTKAARVRPAVKLESIEHDRAIVRLRFTPDEAARLTLVRERGTWKVGVTIGAPSV